MVTDRNYKEYDSRGYAIIYNPGDIVLHEGKRYVCLILHTNKQPHINNSYWKQTTGSLNDYYYTENRPLAANIGDRWIDTLTGRMYTYIEDENGFHWVEF